MNRKLLSIALIITSVYSDELAQILSPQKRDIFKYQEQTNELESSKLSKSWVNPIRLQYHKSYSRQFSGQTIDNSSYRVIVDQPIFKSGGIYHSIKYSDAIKSANATEIRLQKRAMIGSAISILFNIKKLKFRQEKLRLTIINDEIDIKFKSDSYEAGILDSSFLDQSIIKRNSDETELLASQIEMEKLLNNFALLSDRDPNSFTTPTLHLIDRERYYKENLELQRDKLIAREKEHISNMITSQYLPTVSIQGEYVDGDLNPLFPNPNLKEEYTTYGVTVSMPININTFDDIESGKVAYMEASTKVIDREKSVKLEYEMIINTLRILDKKIELDRKDEKLYKRLYSVTKNLAKVGEKTKYDTELIHNSLEIKRLDQKIHNIDKQLQLLALYIKVNSVF
jgi:outer membrane protein TolC